ncbi:piggyBac transposable element-derived protein 3-like [Ixodes scapularis]|uniref:piggyBac transposable element-derived protein 3-like n=1 Tax=Ixodes scapularis TaxID=6945 RepID=UPI001A9EE015|nr:piggyBac transposable element-derived protein 3-like [Ixodes scapularis]
MASTSAGVHVSTASGISDVDSSSDDETDTDNDDTSSKARSRSLEVEESLLEDEAELPKNAASSKQGDKYKWRKTSFDHDFRAPEPQFELAPEDLTPLQYFQMYFGDEFIEKVVYETNLYSTQQTGCSINTNVAELRSFIGILLMMGVIGMPSFEDYWANQTRCDKIANVMPVKRFKKLRRFIHFIDNLQPVETDRAYKIKPVLEHIRSKCKATESENLFSIDEMMIPYKGKKAGNLRQYLPKKPKKWGFKLFVLAGVSGMVHDFILYTGATTFEGIRLAEEDEALGLGAKVVLHLCKSISRPNESIVYFDNFFTSLELISRLKERYSLHSLGTIRSNRLRGCSLKDDKSLLKEGRGSFDYKVDNVAGLAVVKWADNKTVILASSCVSQDPVKTANRFDKKERQKIPVSCPQIVKQYNIHMGGVDLADMYAALYRTPFRTKRWYLGIFSQLLDISVNNAWLLHRRQSNLTGVKAMRLKQFRLAVSEALMHASPPKRGRPSSTLDEEPAAQHPRMQTTAAPVTDVRYDGVGHLPTLEGKGRCRYCPSGQTSIACEKCKVRLCIVTGKSPRNCFRLYHKK